MASAIIGGLLRESVYQADQLACTSAADGTGEAAAERFGISFFPEPEAMVSQADTVVFAFKPQQLKDLSEELQTALQGKLIISILAGTTLERLQAAASGARNIVRSMPNTPGQIGAGITAYAPSLPLSASDQKTVTQVLGALGEVFLTEEEKLDAVTGVSGSGPAYLFEFVAALRDGGIAAGLDPDFAYRLALQTARGASELLLKVPETPEQHRDWVSSPGGTTLAALKVMSERNFRGLMRDAVIAATERSKELAKS